MHVDMTDIWYDISTALNIRSWLCTYFATRVFITVVTISGQWHGLCPVGVAYTLIIATNNIFTIHDLVQYMRAI